MTPLGGNPEPALFTYSLLLSHTLPPTAGLITGRREGAVCSLLVDHRTSSNWDRLSCFAVKAVCESRIGWAMIFIFFFEKPSLIAVNQDLKIAAAPFSSWPCLPIIIFFKSNLITTSELGKSNISLLLWVHSFQSVSPARPVIFVVVTTGKAKVSPWACRLLLLPGHLLTPREQQTLSAMKKGSSEVIRHLG